MRTERSRPVASAGKSRSAFQFVAPVLISLIVMLAAAASSIEVLSTIRAWAACESLYSKGQKNATYYLAQYIGSGAEEDFQRYRTAIGSPLGYLHARLAIQRRPVNLAAAREGFRQGGSDPADVDSILLLYRLVGWSPLINQAVDIWSQGDGYTLQLEAIAERMHGQASHSFNAGSQAETLFELDRINAELTPLSTSLSDTLGRLARVTRTLLVAVLIVCTGITGLLCLGAARARVRERNAKEQGLARLTELYAALSQTSQLVSKVADREHLFRELCRICVGTSGLLLATVALLRPDRARVDFRAVAGRHQDYLQTVSQNVWPDAALAAALHTTIASRRCSIIHRPADPNSPFPSEAAFPLLCQGELIGVLCVYSPVKLFFAQDIVGLMEQLATEASFALDSLCRESERQMQGGILAAQNRILSLIAAGAELSTIFHDLAGFAEAHCTGLCSLTALDMQGTRNCLVVAPSLSQAFRTDVAQSAASDGETGGIRHYPDPNIEAIRSSAPLVIANLAQHPLSETMRTQLQSRSLQTVNVWPILGSKGYALGALSLYGRHDDGGINVDPQVVGICTSLAGIAIENCWAADRIKHLAHHDELTGLPNRLLFSYRLPQSLARAQRAARQVGVFFIDLDRFKVINDTLGHDAGDHVLRQVTRHLQQCLRAGDLLARVGGDEFALIVEQFDDTQDLTNLAQTLLVAMSRPLRISGREYHLSGSIGIAIYPKDGDDSSSLLKNADIAMYRAKAAGKNTHYYYADETDDHSVERLSLESELRKAVAQGEFEVHYQPKMSIGTGRVTGAEALVRWAHPRQGLLPPSTFIFVAEEMGLIGAIGNAVLETVCADLRRWRERGLPPLRIAINLSAQQFADSRLIDNLNRVLQTTECDPQSLEFEITESVVMTNPERALLLLEQMKSYGITLAIDDFGTGHSSLAYLKRFPVDSIKIDYAFIRDIAVDLDDLAITKAIIALGHSLDLKIVAEGVETRTQLDILRNHHCDEYQGFLCSAAIPADRFAEFLAALPPVEDLIELLPPMARPVRARAAV
jgi:diguanylate cyclase (GGDEF)-like protein